MAEPTGPILYPPLPPVGPPMGPPGNPILHPGPPPAAPVHGSPPPSHGTPVPITRPPGGGQRANAFTVTGTTVLPPRPFTSIGQALAFVGEHFPASGGMVTISHQLLFTA